MEADRLLSLIGLCKKAGRLLAGYEVVVESAMQGDTTLVLTAEDLSQRSLRKLGNALAKTSATHYSIPVTMAELEQRIGRKVGILGIADQGFADAIRKMLAE